MIDERSLSPSFSILGSGTLAVDDVLYVAEYPPPDAKARVMRRTRRCGGQIGTALAAAARLGARCAYAAALAQRADVPSALLAATATAAAYAERPNGWAHLPTAEDVAALRARCGV